MKNVRNEPINWKEVRKDIGKYAEKTLASLGCFVFLHGCNPDFKDYEILPESEKRSSFQSEETINPANVHALLINGGSADKINHNFSGQLSSLYSLMTNNGVLPKNICVIDYSGENKGKGINFQANNLGLERAINYLSKTVNTNDILLSHVTNHGMKQGGLLPLGKSLMLVNNSLTHPCMISDETYSGLMKRINSKHKIMTFGQCYSGGFADKIGKDKDIGISGNRSSRIRSCFSEDDFISKSFYPSIFGQVNESQRREIDKNANGRIDVREAFEYAAKQDFFANSYMSLTPFKNTPQMFYGNNVNPSGLSLDKAQGDIKLPLYSDIKTKALNSQKYTEN